MLPILKGRRKAPKDLRGQTTNFFGDGLGGECSAERSVHGTKEMGSGLLKLAGWS